MSKSMNPPEPRMTFVVPVLNDAHGLERCLRSIAMNATMAGDVSVVVVDNGSEDDSAAVAERHRTRVLSLSGKVARLRNTAAREAPGDILAFVDADNEIAAGWVQAALAGFADPTIAAVGAHYEAPPDGTWVQRAYGWLRHRPQGICDIDWLASGNLAVRRTVFDAVGGFDASLEACEDVDLCRRIRAHGYRVVSDSRLRSIHYGDPATLGALFRGERWRGRDNLRVSFRRPFSWRYVPSALFAVLDAVLLGMALGGIVGMLAGWPPARTVGAVALAVFAITSVIRVLRAASREPVSPWRLLQSLVVVLVYDAARALALVSRAPHRRMRPVPSQRPT